MAPPTLVKIAFVLDVTASMGPWIHESKTKMKEIVRNCREDNPDAEFMVALVAYRDYRDPVRFRVMDFDDPDAFVRTLYPIEADGGDDEAEDVAGAFLRAKGLAWHDADVRLLFHIADAPPHGLKFHDPYVSDRFPEGDPDFVDPADVLRSIVLSGVEYTFVRITSKTDKMVDVFSRVCMESGAMFRLIDLNPQSYDGRYGRAERGATSTVLSAAVRDAVNETLTHYTSSQGM